MKSFKQFHLHKSWDQLVRQVEPDPCILLKGEANHFILGWDIEADLTFQKDQFDFDSLQAFLDRFSGRYIFGYLAYDIKNSIEQRLHSSNTSRVNFPEARFFVTRHVIENKEGQCHYFGESDTASVRAFFEQEKKQDVKTYPGVELLAATGRADYLNNVREIQKEIQFGNSYEMNYCVEFFAENAVIDPFETFVKLNALSDAPFSVYLNTAPHFVMSASPERYLKKTGDRLISQPIKGTARREKSEAGDEAIKKQLQQDPKERSENIMIVDLVRNDLSKVAEKNSVKVDELCGVYSFKTVHQLISTVSCNLRTGVRFTDVIKATFPMGSMTGAPKISAMQLAERTENFRRGLYSGTIGYIHPSGDFDFNVVIRSILYNNSAKVVSCSVGGAITINAQPEKEYEECLLKLQALQKALC
ncbi:MAG: anthranilate synthase component I family protein [Bacteroidetes bacterium]|nr:anthranilate synthase component I family protein [Bacteroidota bacterium]